MLCAKWMWKVVLRIAAVRRCLHFRMKKTGEPVFVGAAVQLTAVRMARLPQSDHSAAIIIVLKNIIVADKRSSGPRERTFSLTPCKKRQNHNSGGCLGFAFHDWQKAPRPASSVIPVAKGSMTGSVSSKRLGFFTRLLDDAAPADRYRLAAEQIKHAERTGFDSAWIAQHHFHESEGGLPAPFAFLGFVAAQTSRIRLGTGIVTLPLENPVRVAEDAAVLDLLSNGRLELGVGTGGNPSAFAAFGLDSAERTEIFARNLAIVRNRPGGRAARRWRYALSTEAGIVRPDLASDLFGERRDASRQSGRRLAVVANPTSIQRCPAGLACRDSASHYRRLPGRAAAGARTTNHGVAQRLCRRRS
jgi:hypothetical protein